MKKYAICLAAGKGTRMKTELPKCAYPILKKPMIHYVLDNIKKSDVDEIIVVVGYKKEYLLDIIDVNTVYQSEQLGTAHAVKMALPLLEDGISIILPGDAPLLDELVINHLINEHVKMNNDVTIGAMHQDNPYGYGRLVIDNKKIVKIVEEKEASDKEKQIKIVNTGLIVAKNDVLAWAINQVKNNNTKHEYYLTDIVEILQGKNVGYCILEGQEKLTGINTLKMLNSVENYIVLEKIKDLMDNGVCIVNPNTQTISKEVVIEPGVVIHPGCYITGKTIIKKNAIIGPNTEIHNSIIEEEAQCKHSVVYDSVIKKQAIVGPFAHLRMNSVIGENNRIGNFVEVKNSYLGNNTNAAHLSYIGDTECGSGVNFGCGSITVNYDGKDKHKTIIGDGCFIGCNTNLIAPIIIGKNAYIAAGSTVNKNVPDNALAIARARQENKEGYAERLKKK